MRNLNFPGLPRILVVDRDVNVRDPLRELLQNEGLAVETSENAEEAQRRLQHKAFDLVLLELSGDSLASLSAFREGTPAPDVVILASSTMTNTVEAMRLGATDVIQKPFDQDRVLAVVRRCLEARQLRGQLERANERLGELTSSELIGLSTAVRDVHSRIEKVAQTPDTTVLVTGQSGTGKELVARSIHERSARRYGPFVAVNCAAMAENALEAELFGFESGAYTGPTTQGKEGLFAHATGGTLFLDEISEIDTALQAKLLRVLQERSYRRVGGAQDIPSDVRIIAASNRDLRAEVDAGNFREDLFYRLHVMNIAVPSLSARPEDVPLLAHYFLDQFGRQMGKKLTGFTEEATETLCEYEWPGNVRELKNAIEHAAIVCAGGMIDECHLPTFSGGRADGSDQIQRNVIQLDSTDCSIRTIEGQLVSYVLEMTKWNISRAASMLGINRTTLYNKIRLYGLGSRRPARPKINV